MARKRPKGVLEIGWACFESAAAGRFEHVPIHVCYAEDTVRRITVEAGGGHGWRISALTTPRDKPAPWKIEDGVMVSAKSDIVTTGSFGDIQLHLEFREPTPPKESGQGRGNSGVLFNGIYEVQGQHEELYSQERLLHDVKNLITRAPEELFDELIAAVRGFALNGEFEDDVCLVGVDYVGLPLAK